MIKIRAFVISTGGLRSSLKWSASSPLGMKVVFTLSEVEGLDSVSLRSTLGVP